MWQDRACAMAAQISADRTRLRDLMSDEMNFGSVYDSYLAADVRPAIHAASVPELRTTLDQVVKLLCHHAQDDFGPAQAITADSRLPYEICEVGRGIKAGLQLYRHVGQAVAGSYLNSMGYETARLIADRGYADSVIGPSASKATEEQAKGMLLALANHMDAVVKDGVIAASAPGAASDVTAADDLQDIAAGASLAIALYSHTACQIAVYVLYKMWMNLDRTFRPGLSNLRSLKDEEYLSSNPN